MNDRDKRRDYHLPRMATQMPSQRMAVPPAHLDEDDWPDGVPRELDDSEDVSVPHEDESPMARLERVGRRTERRTKRQSEHLGIIVGLFKAEMDERRAERQATLQAKIVEQQAVLEAKKLTGDRLWKAVMYVLGILAAAALGGGAVAGVLR